MVARSQVFSEYYDEMGRCKHCNVPMDVVESGTLTTPIKFRCRSCQREVVTESVQQIGGWALKWTTKVAKFLSGL
jgi:transposase-like protein